MSMPRLLLCLLILSSACDASTGPGGKGGGVPAGAVAVVEAYPGVSFERPVGAHSIPDGSGRLLIVEQRGVIRVLPDDPGAGSAPVFMDLRDRVNAGGNEEGLLGLAFHPGFSENGRFFVDYSAADPRRTVLAEFRVQAADPDQGDPGTERVILEIPQPFSNHNGGQIAFGPDGFLYVALGDGGGAGDPEGNGQDPTSLLGAILRIDVDDPDPGKAYGVPSDNPFVGDPQGFREEIFAYGFRNPWRFSFDPASGALWAGDVGQNRIEEIDLVTRGGNYGWNVMEGSACFVPSSGCDQAGLTLPVAEYGHDLGFSVTGGFVYRGSAIPGLEGRYLYADFGTGRIWALDADQPGAPEAREILRTDLNIASFGVDGSGEILLCAFDGRIYRLVEGGG